MNVRSSSIDLKLDLSCACDAFVEELSTALPRLGIQFEAGVNGRVMQGVIEVGRVMCWQPQEQIVLEWHGAEWQPAEGTKVELRFERIVDDARITLEHQEWSNLLGDPGNELAGWFASEVAAPLLGAMAPSRLGDWITDRRARRSSGPQARANPWRSSLPRKSRQENR